MTDIIKHTFIPGVEIRTVTVDNVPMFIAKDVAEALGYARADQAVSTHCKRAVKLPPEMRGSVDSRLKLIPESDVYRLGFRSKLESAEHFQDWVTEVVLPSIRKNGGYLKDQEKKSPMEIIRDSLLMAESIIIEQAVVIADKTQQIRDRALPFLNAW